MYKKLLFFILSIFIFISCSSNIDKFYQSDSNDDNIYNVGRYRTDYVIYWNGDFLDKFVIYTDDSVYTCSFQGTNYLLEQNNKEEIVSTTAPIKILKCQKIE